LKISRTKKKRCNKSRELFALCRIEDALPKNGLQSVDVSALGIWSLIYISDVFDISGCVAPAGKSYDELCDARQYLNNS